jgi:aryl-alcohol dehydrogenase-like predicted oxidoreductase
MMIGLGTAQFGLDYGITNRSGRVSEDELQVILAHAAAAGIEVLDTAPAYGTSEELLGRHAPDGTSFRIVTKTPKFAAALSGEQAVDWLRNSFERSLEHLRRGTVHGLLFHDADDLLGPFGDRLWQAMEELAAVGQVTRIGVSVYDGAQIDSALDRYPIGIVQLPWNPVDHRLVSGGQLGRLAAQGVEVHARSLFLQGLLLEEPSCIPARFAQLGAAAARMRSAFDAAGLTLLEGIMTVALRRTEIHRLICGVTTVRELEDIVCAAKKAVTLETPLDFTPPQNLDLRLLNPARWNELEG